VVVKLTVIVMMVVVILHWGWERGKVWKGDGKRNRRVWGLIWDSVRLRIETQTRRKFRILLGFKSFRSVPLNKSSQIKFGAQCY